ncbi:MAG TPA: SMP-30/gluconolactonase/LRE family protein [Hyphomicrobiaceae bacterium]|nr:SMP-30/gluconolactonase/LRE family protein [Hyphomicrobiaceae bacterium]
MPAIREIASGLLFPEGPIAMPDGSILLVEIARGTLSRVDAKGKVTVVAETGGGPNGAAIGPDGACYITNNGGFEWVKTPDGMRPHNQARNYTTGSIQRVDLKTGKVDTLYTKGPNHKLNGPNDLVFDAHGGFYFTDLGKRRDRDMDTGCVYYAKADGSLIKEIAFPLMTPNGCGLSPDGKVLYVAETQTGRVWAFDIEAPGEISKKAWPSPHGGRLLAGVGGFNLFDSLAVDSAGHVCVATLFNPGITAITPDGRNRHIAIPGDPYCTNICFGGPDLKTAFVTLSMSGRLVAMDWERPGAKLNYLNT